MLIPNHPHDERLSALASTDDDAVADAELSSHVASCVRCTGVVSELRAIRGSLADLPDLQPSRPLRLLPEVADDVAPTGPADRLAGLVRRLFGPALAAGAAIAMVGVVGTTAPAMTDSLFQNIGTSLSAEGELRDAAGGIESFESEAPAAAPGDGATTYGSEDAGQQTDELRADAPAERSPWPMVAFTGVAIIIGAVMLRWILVPRAG